MRNGAARQTKRVNPKTEPQGPALHVVQADTAAQIRRAQGSNQARERHYHKEIARRRRLIACLGIFFVVIFSVNLLSSAVKLNAALAQLRQVNRQLDRTRGENGKLKTVLTNLKQPDYLAQVLRDKYQYSKKGEVIFNLPAGSDTK
ncbi:FtsB family cell division protein [Oenococcus kitaharae]|uniref:FtsB family cell division protein n=1 Tax=Oenococcus TaxID=46254 RepID=UPI000489F49F|nr:septum formation initiator family protein [Oenococcus kitaharae]MCV3296318.1 septum formation initiator family protein [Oenococcus kitaharae]OEY81400.1 septum formation inhibitor MinC [Oenococcus kitaharae]OEY82888.1 septum formation inhibitor MinC [Oenococcus kitaharae]OEY84568.1 septum formation inhibitor MinC [Oenococcus kitaharae]